MREAVYCTQAFSSQVVARVQYYFFALTRQCQARVALHACMQACV